MIVGQIPGGDGTFIARITYSGAPPPAAGVTASDFTCEETADAGVSVADVGVNQYEVTFTLALFDAFNVDYNGSTVGLQTPDTISIHI